MERKAYVVAEHCTAGRGPGGHGMAYMGHSPWMPKYAAGLPVSGKGVHPKGTSTGEGRVQQNRSARGLDKRRRKRYP
jgi:hypothetical protein